jgi:hypothetical protein
MGIEITSGGVSKTYRYYPYDAFYVDANGNVNTSGNGQQVKEAWFNGGKYYPEAASIWGGKITAIGGQDGNESARVYTLYGYRSQIYYVGLIRMSLAWCLVFDSERCHVEEDKRRPSIGRYGSHLYLNNGYSTSDAHLELVARIDADFHEDAVSTSMTINPFNVNNFSAESQALFGAIAIGVNVSCSADLVLGANDAIVPTDTSGVSVLIPHHRFNNGSYDGSYYDMPGINFAFTDPSGPWGYTLGLHQNHSWNGWSQFNVNCVSLSGTNYGSTGGRKISYYPSQTLVYNASSHLLPDAVMQNSCSRLQYQKYESPDGRVVPADLLPLPS